MDAQLTKLTKLITDLLDLSRMQTGMLAFQRERFNLDSLIDEIVENVDRHGGGISVKSRKGEGATFCVTLPILQEGE